MCCIDDIHCTMFTSPANYQTFILLTTQSPLRKKGRDLTQSFDKSPFTHRKISSTDDSRFSLVFYGPHGDPRGLR